MFPTYIVSVSGTVFSWLFDRMVSFLTSLKRFLLCEFSVESHSHMSDPDFHQSGLGSRH